MTRFPFAKENWFWTLTAQLSIFKLELHAVFKSLLLVNYKVPKWYLMIWEAKYALGQCFCASKPVNDILFSKFYSCSGSILCHICYANKPTMRRLGKKHGISCEVSIPGLRRTFKHFALVEQSLPHICACVCHLPSWNQTLMEILTEWTGMGVPSCSLANICFEVKNKLASVGSCSQSAASWVAPDAWVGDSVSGLCPLSPLPWRLCTAAAFIFPISSFDMCSIAENPPWDHGGATRLVW